MRVAAAWAGHPPEVPGGARLVFRVQGVGSARVIAIRPGPALLFPLRMKMYVNHGNLQERRWHERTVFKIKLKIEAKTSTPLK